MSSHSATLVETLEQADAHLHVRMLLACGCEVADWIRADRLIETVGGERLLVGKYVCPRSHPVKRMQRG